ncbi:interleukin-8-like [Clinocottus analis]|uniref:interleukin-8-like n=1 Tax=Clinocottus analis TaxID=304258 RepID=UPI0035C23341
MSTRALLLLLLLCSVSSLHALPRQGCVCFRLRSSPIPRALIREVTLIPTSGLCRRTQVIVNRTNGFKVCVDPKEKWVKALLSNLDK